MLFYSITYKDQGGSTFSGTHAEGYPTTHTYGTATTLKGATKVGYDFNGWYTTSDCSGSAITTLGAGAYTDNIILYANWIKITYHVTYEGNNQSWGLAPVDETAYDPGATVTVLGNTGSLTKDGYEFSGWCVNMDGKGTTYQENETFTINNNTTLYAKWNGNTYNLSYRDEGDKECTAVNVNDFAKSYTNGKDEGTYLGNPVRTNPPEGYYQFEGFYWDADCTDNHDIAGNSINPTRTLTEDTTLYLKWSYHAGS